MYLEEENRKKKTELVARPGSQTPTSIRAPRFLSVVGRNGARGLDRFHNHDLRLDPHRTDHHDLHRNLEEQKGGKIKIL